MYKEIYMSLNKEASSAEAFDLIELLALECLNYTGKVRKPTIKAKNALSAILGDLLEASSTCPVRRCFRPTGNSDFSGHRIGSRPFGQSIKALEGLGFVSRKAGTKLCSPIGSRSRSASFRMTSKLLRQLSTFDITPVNYSDHFKLTSRPRKCMSRPVILRSCKNRSGPFISGKDDIVLDFSKPKVAAICNVVEELNRYFSSQTIQLSGKPMYVPHVGFRRIFSNGDIPSFDWDQGGRLYSVDPSGYQQIPAAERAKLLINGKCVVELDIRASHITIVRALAGEHFDPKDDPYHSIPGVPRDVVKTWVTIALGQGKIPSKWTAESRIKYREATGKDLSKDHPMKVMRDLVPQYVTCFKDWDLNPVGWGTLQFLESEAIIASVSRLAFDYDIPALPVHDSLIVAQNNENTAMKTLKDEFHRVIGVKPYITKK